MTSQLSIATGYSRKQLSNQRKKWFFLALVFLVAAAFLPSTSISSYFIYFLTFILSFLFIFQSNKSKGSTRLFFLILAIFSFAFVMMFRSQKGIDDWVYKHIYDESLEGSLFSFIKSRDEEIGFLIITRILSFFTAGNYNLYQSLLAFGSVSLWFFAIEKYKKLGINTNWFYLFVITHYYFLIMSAALLRIFIAIPIVFIAIYYFNEKKYIKTILLILVAALFHRSAAIFIIIFLYAGINKRISYLYRTLLLFAIVPVLFILASKYIVPMLGSKYAGYGNLGSFSISLSDLDLIPILFLGSFGFIYVDKEHRNLYLLGLSLVGISTIFSIWNSLVSFGRVAYYSNLGIIIVCGMSLASKRRDAVNDLISVLLILYSCFYLFYTCFLNGNQSPQLFPFEFFS